MSSLAACLFYSIAVCRTLLLCGGFIYLCMYVNEAVTTSEVAFVGIIRVLYNSGHFHVDISIDRNVTITVNQYRKMISKKGPIDSSKNRNDNKSNSVN